MPLDATVVRALVDAAPDGVLMTDEEGHVLFANRRAESQFGYSANGLVGRSVEDLLPDRLRQAHRTHRARYRAEPRLRPMGVGLVLFGQRTDGTEFPVEISLSPFTTEDGARVVAVIRDMSERIETEERLRRAEQHVHIVEDRERIARDLHDTIREIRSVVFGLQGDATHAPGLRADVLRIVEEEQAALGFAPRIRFDGPVDATSTRVTAELSPVLREALSNVARHADASSVDVEVERSGDLVTLRVRDDGRGLPSVLSEGHGLANLSQRAEKLGGECRATTRAGGGTELEWRVPDSAS